MTNTIMVWRFEDAPSEFQELSGHGGDEDWLAYVPDSLKNEYIGWLETGGQFGCSDVERHHVLGGVVHIGAHS